VSAAAEVVGGWWSVVDGRWSVVDGRWSVVDGRCPPRRRWLVVYFYVYVYFYFYFNIEIQYSVFSTQYSLLRIAPGAEAAFGEFVAFNVSFKLLQCFNNVLPAVIGAVEEHKASSPGTGYLASA
jgi:hypothetical protein